MKLEVKNTLKNVGRFFSDYKDKFTGSPKPLSQDFYNELNRRKKLGDKQILDKLK